MPYQDSLNLSKIALCLLLSSCPSKYTFFIILGFLLTFFKLSTLSLYLRISNIISKPNFPFPATPPEIVNALVKGHEELTFDSIHFLFSDLSMLRITLNILSRFDQIYLIPCSTWSSSNVILSTIDLYSSKSELSLSYGYFKVNMY